MVSFCGCVWYFICVCFLVLFECFFPALLLPPINWPANWRRGRTGALFVCVCCWYFLCVFFWYFLVAFFQLCPSFLRLIGGLIGGEAALVVAAVELLFQPFPSSNNRRLKSHSVFLQTHQLASSAIISLVNQTFNGQFGS